jgi:Protein of unknown function DUF262
MIRTLSEQEQRALNELARLYLEGQNMAVEALAVWHALRDLPRGVPEKLLATLVPDFVDEPNGAGAGYYRPALRGLLSSSFARDVEQLLNRFLAAVQIKWEREGAFHQLLWQDVKAALPAEPLIADDRLDWMVNITIVVWPNVWRGRNGSPDQYIWARPNDLKELIDAEVRSAQQLLKLRDSNLESAPSRGAAETHAGETATESSSGYGDHTAASVREDAAAINAIAGALSVSTEDVRRALGDVHGKTLVRNVFGAAFVRAEGVPVEEADEEGSTGVEEEQNADTLFRPYDPDKIRVDPKSFSLRQILDEIGDGGIDLAPDFQRNRVWSEIQRVRLVESVLLRVPLPAFYFSADQSGRLSVVDGVQRLSTIQAFVNGGFALTRKALEYLDVGSLKQKTSRGADDECWYQDLDPQWRRRINQTQIMANVIDPQTPEQVKFDIFKRINTGGSPLNAQEIRHSMMRARSRAFLKKLAESVAFRDATPSKIHNHRRMADREVVLRYLAFALLGDLAQYPPDSTMDAFLMTAVKRLDDEKSVSDEQLDALSDGFERAMRNAAHLFGEHAFRKWPAGNERLLPFNKALFDSWGFALRDADPAAIRAAKTRIVEEARNAMREREYNDSITVSTGDARNVRRRFAVPLEIVARSKL